MDCERKPWEIWILLGLPQVMKSGWNLGSCIQTCGKRISSCFIWLPPAELALLQIWHWKWNKLISPPVQVQSVLQVPVVNICHSDIAARWEMPCIILDDNSELVAKCRHLQQWLPGEGRNEYHHAPSSERGICPNTTMGMSLASCPRCGESKPDGYSMPRWDLAVISSWSQQRWGATSHSKPFPVPSYLTPCEAVLPPEPSELWTGLHRMASGSISKELGSL